MLYNLIELVLSRSTHITVPILIADRVNVDKTSCDKHYRLQKFHFYLICRL